MTTCICIGKYLSLSMAERVDRYRPIYCWGILCGLSSRGGGGGGDTASPCPSPFMLLKWG